MLSIAARASPGIHIELPNVSIDMVRLVFCFTRERLCCLEHNSVKHNGRRYVLIFFREDHSCMHALGITTRYVGKTFFYYYPYKLRSMV